MNDYSDFGTSVIKMSLTVPLRLKKVLKDTTKGVLWVRSLRVNTEENVFYSVRKSTLILTKNLQTSVFTVLQIKDFSDFKTYVFNVGITGPLRLESYYDIEKGVWWSGFEF